VSDFWHLNISGTTIACPRYVIVNANLCERPALLHDVKCDFDAYILVKSLLLVRTTKEDSNAVLSAQRLVKFWHKSRLHPDHQCCGERTGKYKVVVVLIAKT
jgi:hypothetical protein